MSTPASDSGESLQRVQAAVAAALRQDGEGEPLARLCQACVELLPVDGASVSVISSAEQREMLHASDAVIATVESVQFTLGEGPCFEAFTTRRPVLVPDLATNRAWSVFASEVSDQPIEAIFAFPLQSGAARIGALDMYRRAPGWLTEGKVATALQVADLATVTLLALMDGGSTSTMDGEWLAALPRGREVVHQATGMLIAEFGIPPAQALSRLRAHAFTTNRLVENLAGEIVTRRLTLRDIDI